MHKTSPAPRGAFTLIEILVVIGIIALIAAISFPVFSRVRQGGYKTVCASNLKQLGLAFQQYAQDYNNRYPRGGNLQNWADGGHWVTGGKDGTPTNFGVSGADANGLADPTTFAYVEGHQAYPDSAKTAIYQYVKTPVVFSCPAAPDVNKKRLSYSMNCAVAGALINRVRSPGEIVLLVDEGDTLNDGYFWAVNKSASTDALFKGHLGSGNLLFVDGHVKSYDPKAFPLDSSTEGLNNKWRGTGAPRFHDRALGVNGSNVTSATADACSLPLSEVRDWSKTP